MSRRPVTITKNELKGYADVMRAAQVTTWTVKAVRPDGTQIVITAGADEAAANPIDGMLGISK